MDTSSCQLTGSIHALAWNSSWVNTTITAYSFPIDLSVSLTDAQGMEWVIQLSPIYVLLTRIEIDNITRYHGTEISPISVDEVLPAISFAQLNAYSHLSNTNVSISYSFFIRYAPVEHDISKNHYSASVSFTLASLILVIERIFRRTRDSTSRY